MNKVNAATLTAHGALGAVDQIENQNFPTSEEWGILAGIRDAYIVDVKESPKMELLTTLRHDDGGVYTVEFAAHNEDGSRVYGANFKFVNYKYVGVTLTGG